MFLSTTLKRMLANFFCTCLRMQYRSPAADHSILMVHFFAHLSSLIGCFNMVLLVHIVAWLAACAFAWSYVVIFIVAFYSPPAAAAFAVQFARSRTFRRTARSQTQPPPYSVRSRSPVTQPARSRSLGRTARPQPQSLPYSAAP